MRCINAALFMLRLTFIFTCGLIRRFLNSSRRNQLNYFKLFFKSFTAAASALVWQFVAFPTCVLRHDFNFRRGMRNTANTNCSITHHTQFLPFSLGLFLRIPLFFCFHPRACKPLREKQRHAAITAANHPQRAPHAPHT